MEEKQRIIVIAGPTASGKSAVAMDLALRFGGEIVNADSMQVYRGMDIGTAKPTSEEQGRVTHHLLDVADPDEQFNAAIYRSLALPVLKGIGSAGKTALVVGGTGLYIRVLLGGVLRCAPLDLEFRRKLQEELAVLGLEKLHERMRVLDPESADRIHPHDRIRIIRALEIMHSTGERFSTMIRNHRFKDSPFHALKICLQMERKQLYHRIDERCVRMVENGLVHETERLLKKGYSPDLKPMKALGYRHMVKVLNRTWDLETAVLELQADTRKYAKRQLTWFRAEPEIVWIDTDDPQEMETRIRDFLAGADGEWDRN